MNDLETKNVMKETKIETSVITMPYVIIWFNDNKETYTIKMISSNDNLDLIKKEHEKCIILSINELYNDTIDKKEPLNMNRKVRLAIEYATKMHQNQYRHDGTAYIVHPFRVANYVKKYKESHNIEDLYIAAILHDVIEDTEATYYDIINLFGIQVASLVLELTNDKDLLKELGKTRYLELKMKNMSSWALVIKLCDRLDNTCDLMCSNEAFRNKYIKETLEIIDYVLDNRNLSKTHMNIVSKIIDRLKFVSSTYQYDEYYDSIDRTNEKTNKLKLTKKLIHD